MLVHFKRGLAASALLTMLVAAAFTLGASSANATFISVYCNISTPPKTACSVPSHVGPIPLNQAIYTGAGRSGVSVCEKTLQNGVLITRKCAFGSATSYPNTGPGGQGWVGNDSPWWHTITGWAEVNAPLPSAAAASNTSAQARVATAQKATAISRTAAPADVRAEVAALRSGSSSSVTTMVRPGDTVSLTTTRETLCLDSTRAAGGSCQGYDAVEGGGLLVASICAPDQPKDVVVLYGVVPDGVAAVDAITIDGSSVARAAVAANTFELELGTADAGRVAEIRWTGRSGSKAVGDLIPDDVNC